MTSSRIRNVGVALVLAVVAAALVALYVTNYRKSVQNGAKFATVYVASDDIPSGTIGAQVAAGKFITTESVPKHSIIPGAISSPKQVSNLVAAEEIFKGQQISVRAFRPATQQGVFAQFSGNLRAMMLPGDANQLLYGTLKAGDHVDLVVNIHYKVVESLAQSSNSTSRVASRVVLRNILVLQAPQSTSGASTGSYAAMLALTDSQTQKLFFAMKNGDWTLVLRPTNNPADSPDSVETIESMLGDGLKVPQILQLTGGPGKESINAGN
jgi:Flp pilus assembly protein CpaB